MILLKSSSSQLLSTGTTSRRSNSYLTAGCWQKGGPWMVVRGTSMDAINGLPVEGSRGHEEQRMCRGAGKENCRPFNKTEQITIHKRL